MLAVTFCVDIFVRRYSDAVKVVNRKQRECSNVSIWDQDVQGSLAKIYGMKYFPIQLCCSVFVTSLSDIL